MATTGLPLLDPLSMWRDALNKWESSSNQLANKEMGSEDFARSMNSLLGLSLGLQQALGKANSALLKELNLPSRDELLELGERLQRIEEQLALITRALGAQGAAQAPSAMPPRTRKPASPPADSATVTAARPAAAEPVPATLPVAPRAAGVRKPATAARKKAASPAAAGRTHRSRGG